MRCDSHVHIVGPADRYPQSPTRTYLAETAPLDRLRGLAARRDIDRFVIVQPSFYGIDNTVLLESLDTLDGHGRGVVVVDSVDVAKPTLVEFAVRGVRGLRLNLYSPTDVDRSRMGTSFAAMADLARAVNWHVEVIAPIEVLAQNVELLAKAEAPVVIDHYGVYGHSAPTSAVGRQLLDLLRLPHVWMKLSAPYRVSDDALDTRPNPD
jgi:predicted TIM-barrel fold metal-dependent hydrolase